MQKASAKPTAVPLPSLADILNDLSTLRAGSISLSSALHDEKEVSAPSLEKLQRFKDSASKSQREEGVVENGFEVASDFLKMQQQLSVSRQEMDTLQERLGVLEKELTEVRELIAFNPIK